MIKLFRSFFEKRVYLILNFKLLNVQIGNVFLNRAYPAQTLFDVFRIYNSLEAFVQAFAVVRALIYTRLLAFSSINSLYCLIGIVIQIINSISWSWCSRQSAYPYIFASVSKVEESLFQDMNLLVSMLLHIIWCTLEGNHVRDIGQRNFKGILRVYFLWRISSELIIHSGVSARWAILKICHGFFGEMLSFLEGWSPRCWTPLQLGQIRDYPIDTMRLNSSCAWTLASSLSRFAAKSVFRESEIPLRKSASLWD